MTAPMLDHSSPGPEMDSNAPTDAWTAAMPPFSTGPEPAIEAAPPFVARSAPTAPGRRRRLPQAAGIVAVALLAASFSSVGTAALVSSAVHSGAATAPPISGTLAGTMSTGSSAVAVAAGSAATGTTDSVVNAVAAVSPAVVTITTTTTAQRGPFTSDGTGVGSGFIYAANGYILTNAHVVEGASALQVTLADGRQFPATIVTSDTAADLAVIRITATGLPVATIGKSDALAVGQEIVAIGNPLGTYTGSATAGIVSGTGRTVTVGDELTGQPRTLSGLLQTDAAINPGNSGGPIVDLSGDVVGVATAASSSAQGIGFAIPIDAATSIMAKAVGTSA